MKNKAPSLLGSLLLIMSCTLHDTGYLQEGDPAAGGADGSDAGGAGAPGTSAGNGAIGGASEGGAASGGAGEGGAAEGGDRSMVGGAGAGGWNGTGPCDGDQVKCESSDMIADFESDDGRLCVPGSGTVVAYGDGTGTAAPPLGDVKSYDASDDCDRGSAYALHVLVGGAEDYGYGVALGFPHNVDAVEAGYTGVRFKAKAAKARKISVKVALPTTLDASYGGSCVPEEGPPPKPCNDHPAAAVVVAAGGWLEYEVTLASLKQEDWGVPAALDYSAIVQLHVVFPGPVSGGSADYDVWIDDVTFY
jgi:hypothetical protein